MASLVKHAFASTQDDPANPDLVGKTHWNAPHVIGIELTNRTGDALVEGDVVGLSAADDESVVLVDVLDSLQAFVVAQGAVTDLAAGLFTQAGAVLVNVIGATTRGHYLAKHTTTKALYDTGIAAATTPAPPGAVGLAITGIGTAGQVVAHLFGAPVSVGFGRKGADVASAATLVVPPDVNMVHVTGTTGITALGARPAGTVLHLVFDAALTITHGSTLVLRGGINYTTGAGDILTFLSEGAGTWRQVMPRIGNFPGGLISPFAILGTSPALTGAIRIPNSADIKARNVAGSDDVRIIGVDNNNFVTVGADGTSKIVPLGAVRCDIATGGRLVLPVGADKWSV